MKKGFTLIELLAVIAILAIISLIAVPIVINIINENEENATLRGSENYLDAVNLAKANYMVKNPDYNPSTCFIQTDGNLLCDDIHYIEVDTSGEIPSGGTIIFENNTISKIELIYDSSVVVFDENNKVTHSEPFGTNSTANVVYFDVVKGKTCKDYNEENSKTGYNGLNGTGKQTSCLKFYIIKENDATLDLILDHNTTAMVPWNSSCDNANCSYNFETGTLSSNVNGYAPGPTKVLEVLKNDTKDWNLSSRSDSYTFTGDIYLSPGNWIRGSSYEVNYTGYKARLINAQEIATLVGHNEWDYSKGYFSLDTKTQSSSSTCTAGNTTGCKYGWLYDRTGTTCKAYGCLNNSDQPTAGYWTASSYFTRNYKTEDHLRDCGGFVSFGISYVARIGNACVNNANHYGVRPVITISK